MHWQSLEDAMENGWGAERPYLCQVHGDSNPSASVNSLTGAFICYTCGHRGKYFQEETTELVIKQALYYLDKLEAREQYEENYKPESWLSQFTVLGPGDYWLGRYTEGACQHFKLGQDGDSYATIPLRTPTGELCGVIKRSLDPTQKRKYLYPKGFKMHDTLWNYHQCQGDILVLTEGATDVVAAWEAGHPDAMAIMGSDVSDTQARLLRRYNPAVIYAAFDQDAAGEQAYEALCRKLWDLRVERLWWSDYKDLSEIPLSDRKRLMSSLSMRTSVDAC